MTRSSSQVHFRNASRLILAALLAATPSAIHAQAAPADPPEEGVGDIVVTATRRSEPLSKVPAAITAISSETIRDYDIKGLADFARLVPNLSWGHGTGGVVSAAGSKTVVIRGITGANTTNFYIDDTPIPQSLDPRIYFLDRIEVLRGPQGTLFGSSAMGGTIRLITSPPKDDELTGSLRAQLFDVRHGGTTGVDFQGGLNIPIVEDQIRAQISGIYSYTPGYFKRTFNDPEALNLTGEPIEGPAEYVDNIGAMRSYGVSGTLYITPAAIENLTLTPMIIYSKSKSNGLPLADYAPENLIQRRIENVAEGTSDKSIFTALTASYQTPVGRIVSSTSYFHRNYYNLEDGTDGVLNTYRARYLTAPNGPFAIFPVQATNATREKQFTQEIRFESDFDGPIQLTVGGFYQEIRRKYRNYIPAEGLAAATGGVYSDNNYTIERRQNTENLAAYASVDFTPFENFELSAGIRYSHLKYHDSSWATGNYGFPGTRTFGTKADPVTPRFSAKYNVSPSTMIYSTIAQGFRIGGANNPLGAACEGLGLPYPTTEPIEYKSDKLWSYEAGVKTSLGDRLLFSAAVYRIDWSNRQQAFALRQGLCYSRITTNTGSAVSKGVELETTVKLSRQLSLRGSLGYQDAHVTDPGANTTVVEGQELDGVPEWTGAINADFVQPTDWGSFFLRASYSYNGSSMSYTQTTTGLRRDSYQLADLRTGVDIGQFTITAFARNIFDERPNLSEVNPGASIVVPRYRYFVGQPRTIGLEVGYSF